jgi:hypothetical protein
LGSTSSRGSDISKQSLRLVEDESDEDPEVSSDEFDELESDELEESSLGGSLQVGMPKRAEWRS